MTPPGDIQIGEHQMVISPILQVRRVGKPDIITILRAVSAAERAFQPRKFSVDLFRKNNSVAVIRQRAVDSFPMAQVTASGNAQKNSFLPQVVLLRIGAVGQNIFAVDHRDARIIQVSAFRSVRPQYRLRFHGEMNAVIA